MKNIILLLFIMMIGFSSAADFDNVLKYEKEDMKVVIENMWGLDIPLMDDILGSLELKSHKNVYTPNRVEIGENKLAMYYDFQNWGKEYNDGLGEVIIKDMNTNEIINKDYYFAKAIYETTNEPIYKRTAAKTMLKNGTVLDVYSNEIIGYEDVTRVKEWEKLINNDIPKGNNTIGVFMDIEDNTHIDLIWTVAGQEIDKHAEVVSTITVPDWLNNGARTPQSGVAFHYDDSDYTVISMTIHDGSAGLTRGRICDDWDCTTTFDTATFSGENITFNFEATAEVLYFMLADDSGGSYTNWIGGDDDGGWDPLFLPQVVNDMNWSEGWDFNGNPSTTFIHNWDSITYEPTGGDNSPQVTLVSPVNNSNLTSSTQEFVTVVTDDIMVQNVSLKIDGIIVSTNTSNTNGTYLFTETISEGVHNWSILAFDNNSVSNESATWYFNFTQPPISINLQSPGDISKSEIPLINMSCNAYKEEGVIQLNLTIFDTTLITVTNSTPGENLTISQNINFSEGNYTWGCSAMNAETSATSANRTFEVDYSDPTITLLSPANATTSEVAEINFIFNAIDINGLKNVSLFLDGILNQSNTSGLIGNYSFTKSLSDGAHNWSVRAFSDLDKLGVSETRVISVHSLSPTVNISAPSGSIDFLKIGDNETLSYNISEAGQNLTEHLADCWYVYPQTATINSTSNFTANTYWNVKNGTMTSAAGDDVLRTAFSGSYILQANFATNTLRVSDFSADIPNCASETYSINTVISASEVGQYACTRNEDNKYNIINMTAFNGDTSTFTSYDISTGIECEGNSTGFLYSNGNDEITIFALDSFGLIGNQSSGWSYKITEVNQTFQSNTVEGSTEDFSAFINVGISQTITSVAMVYDGQSTSGTFVTVSYTHLTLPTTPYV